MSHSKNIGQLRIIAGQWRGRKIHFPRLSDIRPTPDNVRETLFNWLASEIHEANCLDLFAGSGALGFESLSRGANRVVFVEKNPKAAQQIIHNARVLKTEKATVITQDSLKWLTRHDGPFDVVFIDPPYQWSVNDPNNLFNLFNLLEINSVMSDGAAIYLEIPRSLDTIKIPDNWEVYRKKINGQVQYQLLFRQDKK